MSEVTKVVKSGGKTTEANPVRLFYSEGLDSEQVEELRKLLQKSLEDPDYYIIMNFPVYWTDAAPGDMLSVEDGNAKQVGNLLDELEAARKDSAHIPIVGCIVSNHGNPFREEKREPLVPTGPGDRYGLLEPITREIRALEDDFFEKAIGRTED